MVTKLLNVTNPKEPLIKWLTFTSIHQGAGWSDLPSKVVFNVFIALVTKKKESYIRPKIYLRFLLHNTINEL